LSETVLSKLFKEDLSETVTSNLFKGRFKRRVSGSRSVHAGQRELQGSSTLDSREYVSALPSLSRRPFNSRNHNDPDFEPIQFNDQGL
jgi:hypothetical protein